MTLLTNRPLRSIAAALSLSLLLPSAALAQDEPTTDTWPTADELRRDLQGIDYAFEFDPYQIAGEAEWRAGLPAVWALTAPVVVDDALPSEDAYETLTLRIVDIADAPAQLLFGATTADDADGEIEAITTVLMEVASRLPDDAGLDVAVWFMSNAWLGPREDDTLALPCVVQEFDGGAMVAWRGGDDAGLESIFGTITHFDGVSPDVEQCRALLSGAVEDPTDPIPAEDATGDTSDDPAAEPVDFTVTPDEAVELIEAGEHIIIDVRTPEEYDAAHVVGAINIHVEEPSFADRIAELDPEQPYLLYCRTGRRSDLAAQQMAAAGFTDLADAGGLADLARAGAPIE